jgi:hypothetical protein
MLAPKNGDLDRLLAAYKKHSSHARRVATLKIYRRYYEVVLVDSYFKIRVAYETSAKH